MARRLPFLTFVALAFCNDCFADAGNSLYLRLGGSATVSAFVSDSGGGGTQGGDPPIAQFIETLRASMRGHGVPLAARNELLEILVPVRPVAPGP